MRGTRRLAWAAAAVCAFIAAVAPAAGAREGATPPQLTGSRAAPRPTSRARPRPCRWTTTSRRARASSCTWRSRRPSTRRTRSARCSSTSVARAAPRPTASRPRQTYRPGLNQRFDIIAWIRAAWARARRPSTARPTRSPTGSTPQPMTTPDNLDVRALVAKDQRYIKRCIDLNDGILAARLDGQRRARHRPPAPVAGRGQDHLLRLLVRHLPGLHVREHVPDALPRHGPRRPGGRQRVHQRPDARPQRPDQRVRAGARALLAGVCGRSATRARLPEERERPVGRLRRADRPAQRATRCPSGDDSPFDGDDVTTGTAAALYSKANWPLLAKAIADAENGDGSLMKSLSAASTATTATARSTRAAIATSPSAPPSRSTRAT